MIETEKIWFNGELVPWKEAKIHILAHVVQYGTGAFEGLRAYNVGGRPAVFRLEDHVVRLLETCKIYRIECPYSKEEISQAIKETVRANELKEAYIRPLVFRGFGEMGINPLGCPVEMAIAAWPWGKYLGKDAMEKGVRVGISSWQRAAPNTFPSLAKISGAYLNSQLIKMEALDAGYDEGIALTSRGYVSEGSVENIFVVKKGGLYTTTDGGSSILPGITRDSAIRLAQKEGIEIVKMDIPREMLYTSDEIFMTGTAVEITPIVSVDHRPIGAGRPGPITRSIQKAYFDLLKGKTPDEEEWLDFI